MRTYGALDLTVSSPAQSFIEPIDTRQVRTWLGLPETDPDEDQDLMLNSLISAAREIAELYQHRDLAVKQYDLRLDSFPFDIELGYPVQSVDLVQYTDSTGTEVALVVGTDYIVDTARNLITTVYGGTWPTATLYPSGGVLVRFTAGYPPTHPFWSAKGARIKTFMQLAIATWHEGKLPAGELPPQLEWLLNMDPNINIP